MLKWIGGIVSAVIISTATYYLTAGARIESHPAPYLVTGTWHYTTTSDVSHQAHQGSVTLTQADTNITGVMTTFDSSSSGVTGTLIGSTLTLSRDTQLDTVQEFQMQKVSDDRFTGTFRNIGKYQDSGSIELSR